ncbi:MAG: hypothetical protein ACLQHK_03575, partial [Gallionellaceae bacterium]
VFRLRYLLHRLPFQSNVNFTSPLEDYFSGEAQTVCGYQNLVDDGLIERERWNRVAKTSALLAIWLALGVPFAFYGVRWILTGRIMPIWLLSKSFHSSESSARSSNERNDLS